MVCEWVWVPVRVPVWVLVSPPFSIDEVVWCWWEKVESLKVLGREGYFLYLAHSLSGHKKNKKGRGAGRKEKRKKGKKEKRKKGKKEKGKKEKREKGKKEKRKKGKKEKRKKDKRKKEK